MPHTHADPILSSRSGSSDPSGPSVRSGPCIRSTSSITVLAIAAAAALGIAAPHGHAQTDASGTTDSAALRVGVVPQQSATRLARIWTPFLDAVSTASGHDLVFGTAKDIPTFEACLAQGAYDLAYMNPYHYTVFHDASGYQAFARQKDKQLRGLIVVHKDTDAARLDDLDGADIAFPSPAAFGASVIPRAELSAQNIAFTPHYVKSHDSVYRAVSAGLLAAGGGVMRTFNTVADDVRADLKVIYRTDGYTPHAFAAHPDVPGHVVGDVLAAMQSLDAAAPEALAQLGMVGIEPGVDGDWDDVRGLDLNQDQTQIVDDGTITCHSG